MGLGLHDQGGKAGITEHIQPVLYLRWSKKNDLMSCAADNNAYVISFNETLKKWKGSLVNISGSNLRALSCCDWSHDGERFAIGSGTGDVFVGFFDKVNNQWDTVPITGKEFANLSWPEYNFVSEISPFRADFGGELDRRGAHGDKD